MQEANSWLEELLHISEGTPYQSNLIVPKELRTQAATPESSKIKPSCTGDMLASDDLEISGITIFQLGNGVLTFKFFVNNSSMLGIEEREAFSASVKSKTVESKVRLQISNLDFSYPVKFNSLPSELLHFNRNGNVSSSCDPLEGTIMTTSFGRCNESLDWVGIWFRDLPKGRWGNGDYRYYQGRIRYNEVTLSEDKKKIMIPFLKLGCRTLSIIDLRADGWSVSLREIPHEKRDDSDITHFCEITRQENIVTGKMFREFIEDNLITFLKFLFGQDISLKRIEGRRKRDVVWGDVVRVESDVVWVEIFWKREVSPRTLKNNWFFKRAIRDDTFNIEQQFQNFYQLPPALKKQWQKVIHYYICSEEIAGTLHEYTAAASVSFSALEGLTRSIISTYSDGDQWLEKDLRLKRGKGILDAIEMVARQEFGDNYSKVFKMASKKIREIRNATMHLDLSSGSGSDSDEDLKDTFYRWNISQALIEILLLKKLGIMKETYNRTLFPIFRVNGQDMFADERKRELRFDKGQPNEEHPSSS